MSEPPIDSPETLPGWVFPWPRLEPDWARAALLVVDMQNYCCNPGAGLGPMLAGAASRGRRVHGPAARDRDPDGGAT